MGGSGSKPEPEVKVPEPATIPVWRKTEWGNQKRTAMKEDLIKFHPRNPELKHVRILLIGPVGAGKSSFITSVNNIFQDRITSIAPTNTQSSTSYTTTYQTYHIENGNKRLSFVFNDIMGLEKDLEELKGVHLDDIISAICGQMKDGHKFVPEKPLRDDRENKYFRDTPALSEEVFCLVYILPAHKVNLTDEQVFKKMREIRTRIKDLALPQVIVLTHVDEACPLVKNDLKTIYTSKKIREKMVFCSESLGVSMCHVFPVKNYHEEISINEDIDVLILKALDQIVYTADDCGNARADKEICTN